MNYYKNIKDNFWPLTFIVGFICLFAIFLSRGSPTGEEKEIVKMDLKIGFYKPGDIDEEDYFENLITELNKALGTYYEIEFTCYNYLEGKGGMGEDIKNGKIHIAGELSPIEYNKYFKKYKFNAFLGIDYNGHSFYRSLFFVPQIEFKEEQKELEEDKVKSFIGEKTVGRDYIADVKRLLEENEKEIVCLNDKNSTSEFYYPKCFMIDNDIGSCNVAYVSEHKFVFNKVLKKTVKDEHKFIAGFLADFRYYNYFKKQCKCVWHLQVYNNPLSVYGLDILANYQYYIGRVIDYYNLFCTEDYYKPLVIYKSDPIPNGVFVISKAKENDHKLDVKRVIRLWKGIEDVKLPTGSKITGWYTGLDKYLKVVEEIQNRVDANESVIKHPKPIYFSIITVILIIVSTFPFFILKMN